MNIETVRQNLVRTIDGKEKFLNALDSLDDVVAEAIKSFLQVNISELRTILSDVELCIEDAKVDSWKGVVDRQGGSFTVEEMDPNRGWV